MLQGQNVYRWETVDLTSDRDLVFFTSSTFPMCLLSWPPSPRLPPVPCPRRDAAREASRVDLVDEKEQPRRRSVPR